MYIKEGYITDTCASDYKDKDGAILQMINNIDKTCDGDILCRDEDKSVMVILDEDDEESCAIQEDNQYELIICRTI